MQDSDNLLVVLVELAVLAVPEVPEAQQVLAVPEVLEAQQVLAVLEVLEALVAEAAVIGSGEFQGVIFIPNVPFMSKVNLPVVVEYVIEVRGDPTNGYKARNWAFISANK
jgi:hypothetical protein